MPMNFKVEVLVQTPQGEGTYDVLQRLTDLILAGGFDICYIDVKHGVLVDNQSKVLPILRENR